MWIAVLGNWDGGMAPAVHEDQKNGQTDGQKSAGRSMTVPEQASRAALCWVRRRRRARGGRVVMSTVVGRGAS